MASLHTIVVMVMCAIVYSGGSLTEQESHEIRSALVVNQIVLQQQSELLKESCRADEGNHQDQLVKIFTETLKAIIVENKESLKAIVEGHQQEQLGLKTDFNQSLQAIHDNQQILQEELRLIKLALSSKQGKRSSILCQLILPYAYLTPS